MQYISFIPAELNEILGQQGLSWPKHLPMAASGGEYRSLQEICDWHELEVQQIPFPEIFEVLVKGDLVCQIQRIARRQVNDNWQVYQLVDKTPYWVAFNQSGAMIDLTWFKTESVFWEWLISDYQNFSLPEIPFLELANVSALEWRLQIALCDQFLRMYPQPDIEWTPDQLVVFTLASLQADAEQQGGWTEGWNQLLALPHFSEEDWEESILTWCNEGRLGKLDMPDGSDVFMIANSWLWLVRSMAWWDKGFSISLPDRKEQLFFVQASALWAIASDGERLDVAAVDGPTIKRLLEGFTNRKISTTRDSKIQATTNFCPECGKAVGAQDKFCRSCGSKL